MIKLNSYNKFFRVEKKLYRIENFVFPAPILINDLIFFCSSIAVVFMLSAIFPFMSYMPVGFRYIFLPFGSVIFLRKVKFDGKNPIKFIFDFFMFLPLKNKQYQYFRECQGEKLYSELRADWTVSCRTWR